MPLRICPSDPLLDLLRARFEGLNVLGTPTPSLRPLTVVALPRRGDPVELGALQHMLLDPNGFPSAVSVREEGLPDLAGQSTTQIGLDLAARLLPAVLGAFGADASLMGRMNNNQEFCLRFGGVRALRVDRAQLGRALADRTLDLSHPHTGFLTRGGARFAVVDRVILADEVEVQVRVHGERSASASGPSPDGLGAIEGGVAAGGERVERVSTRSPTPVVLAWSCLVYQLSADGRIGVLRGEVQQMDDADAETLGERVQGWPTDQLGRVRHAGEALGDAPIGPVHIARQATGDVLFRSGPLRQSAEGTRGETDQYGPTFDAGPADLWRSGERIGVVFTATPSAGTATEDMLLIRRTSGATYPELAPLTGDGSRSSVTLDGSAASFSDRADFLDEAWDELSPGSGTTVYHVRARARRYTVNNPSQLSSALSGAQGSEWVDKLVERDNTNQVVNTGWIYVEALAYDGTIHRRVHQFTPSGMALPPGTNTLTLEPGSGMTLSSLVTSYVSSGWKYAAANVDASVVQGGPLTAGSPAAPELLVSNQGVTAI